MNAKPFRVNLELVKPALGGFQIQMIFDVVKGKFFSLPLHDSYERRKKRFVWKLSLLFTHLIGLNNAWISLGYSITSFNWVPPSFWTERGKKRIHYRKIVLRFHFKGIWIESRCRDESLNREGNMKPIQP